MANTKRSDVIRAFKAAGLSGLVNRKRINEVCEEYSIKFPHWIKDYNAGWGVFNIDSLYEKEPIEDAGAEKEEASEEASSVATETVFTNPVSESLIRDASVANSFVPKRFDGYVPFGHYDDVKSIISSKRFYTTFVTGLSGNGKTLMIEEVCGELNRECIRANITIETDEDDLIGGFRLIQGETVWQDGPVITAMKRGAILLLDEVDLGSHKMMCLQPVLEGKPIYIKKINQVVYPAPGFNILATANTKGRGNDNGKFVGTMILNEAFLERFSVTFEQDYPSAETEKKILNSILKRNGKPDEDFTNCLTRWSKQIRMMYEKGEEEEMISTRRLTHICEAYSIFGKREKALDLCLSRFDTSTKKKFIDFYSKIDVEIRNEREAEQRRKEREAQEAKRLEELKKNPPKTSPQTANPMSPPPKSSKAALDLEKDFPF